MRGDMLRRSDRGVPLFFERKDGTQVKATAIEPDAIKRDENKLNTYCFEHGETTVMDALKDMGLSK